VAAAGENGDAEAQRAAAEARFPANKWVALGRTKVVIPKPWDNGRLKGVNSFGSEVYCDRLGEMLSLDGHTTAPAGKATPNNHSDSLYAFNPMTGVFRLVKRSNWRAGHRGKGPRGSYPLDDNRTEATPRPRHTYNGICWNYLNCDRQRRLMVLNRRAVLRLDPGTLKLERLSPKEAK
jgi:hypothetical protein